MWNIIRRCRLLAVGFAAVMPFAAAEPLAREDIVKRGQAATALLIRDDTNMVLSGFCVHPSGLIVTHERVIQSGGDRGLLVVLGSGLTTQRVLPGKVVRADPATGLALVEVEGAKDLPTLRLGSVEPQTELLELTSFGFPFTMGPPSQGKYTPALVQAGRGVAVWDAKGQLFRIQPDRELMPGSFGGPLLDRHGHVVGVVTPEYAIPPGAVSRFLAQSTLQFTPPVLTRATAHQLVLFEVRVLSSPPPDAARTAELRLRAGTGKERSYPMELGNGVYRAKAVPVPEPVEPSLLRLEVRFRNGWVQGSVFDRSLKIGGQALKLGHVRTLRWGPRVQAVLRDGKTLEGPLTGLEVVEVPLGGEALRVSLAGAVEARIDVPREVTSVTCTIVLLQDGKEVSRLSDTLPIECGELPGAPLERPRVPQKGDAPGPHGAARPGLQTTPQRGFL